MANTTDPKDPTTGNQIEVPPESVILTDAYKKSSLTAADLAASTGLSVSAVRVALAGIRFRSGEPRLAVPPDKTVAKLAATLGVSAATLTEVGRPRAAALLNEAEVSPPPDLDTAAAIAARSAVVRRVLGVFTMEEVLSTYSLKQVLSVYRTGEILGEFSTTELDKEIKRREDRRDWWPEEDEPERSELDQAIIDDAADQLTIDRWPR